VQREPSRSSASAALSSTDARVPPFVPSNSGFKAARMGDEFRGYGGRTWGLLRRQPHIDVLPRRRDLACTHPRTLLVGSGTGTGHRHARRSVVPDTGNSGVRCATVSHRSTNSGAIPGQLGLPSRSCPQRGTPRGACLMFGPPAGPGGVGKSVRSRAGTATSGSCSSPGYTLVA